jgi:hypothetical protein
MAANVLGDDTPGGKGLVRRVMAENNTPAAGKGSDTERPTANQEPAVERDARRRNSLDQWKRGSGRGKALDRAMDR